VPDFVDYPFRAETYAARLPSLDDRHAAAVAIVGGGPVGLTAALALARHGIRSIVIEADSRVCTGSRAVCVSRRSLEILARLGAAEPFLRKGLPWTGGRSYYRDREVLRFQMPQDDDQRFPPMINLQQFHIEQFLVDAVARHQDLIEIRWQTEVTEVVTDPVGVTLGLRTPLGDYRLHSDWVIACDGARSLVRDALGVKLQGTTYEGRYVIVDIALESTRPTERFAWFDPPSNPGSTILMHKQPDGIWRVDYQLRDDEDAAEAIKPEHAIPRVASHLNMIGEIGAWAPIWISLYKANALTLEKYRHGRVLFAGDAAHLLPIFGVRGLNSGFEDADNVAWKLALVVKGLASDHLLDNYSAERVYAARSNLRYATKSTEFMAPPSFAYALMRTAALGLAVNNPVFRSLINPRQTSAIVYTGSTLNAATRSEDFSAGPVPGAVLPESPINLAIDGRREGFLTELIESRFTLLEFTSTGVVSAAMMACGQRLGAAGIPFGVIGIARVEPSAASSSAWDSTGRLFPLYDATPGTVYLVRPDGHVLGRWRAPTGATIESAVHKVLGIP
jgi:3-(3-hydroxy-phenyl)propionate hydroxylase